MGKATVTVSGSGAASALPDRAVLRVSAAHRAPGVAEAFAGADGAAKAAVAVASQHLEARRTATTDVAVWRTHGPDGDPSGFEARHSLRIECPDLPVAETLLAALADAVGDALSIDGVQLEVADARTAEAAARRAAFDDARAKAVELAGYAGRELGRVVSVVEGSGFGGTGTPRLAMAADGAALHPGERQVHAAVTVTWRLGDALEQADRS